MEVALRPKGVIVLDDVPVRRDLIVPQGFYSDGASIPTLAMRLFTHTDLNKMKEPAVIHDYMCANMDKYKRKDASNLFAYHCRLNGLGDKWYTAWKPYLVYYSVELYQRFIKGWK